MKFYCLTTDEDLSFCLESKHDLTDDEVAAQLCEQGYIDMLIVSDSAYYVEEISEEKYEELVS